VRRRRRARAWGVPLGALALLSSAPLLAANSLCLTRDLFTPYLRIVRQSSKLTEQQQVRAFRGQVLAADPALYAPGVLGLAPDKLDAAIVAGLKASRTEEAQEAATAHWLSAELPQVLASFTRELPDFRCDFTLYLLPTLGQLDGAGRVVGGQPALLLGVDSIAHLESSEQLPVFLDHELFHRYHYQVAGFSDDPSDAQEIWRTLWVEGLATYASARLNPTHDLGDAFLAPRDLAEQCQPQLPRLARELASGLERRDPLLYAQYFRYGSAAAHDTHTPDRAGYYVGYRVAESLGRERTLQELAHLQGDALLNEIRAALESLQAKPDATSELARSGATAARVPHRTAT
jgi:hypothetical protein